MTIVRRLIRLWLALVIGVGLTPLPVAGAGATLRVEGTGVPPGCAAIASTRPIDAARLSRGELRVDAASRSPQKTLDSRAHHHAWALTSAGRAPVPGRAGRVHLATASTFALRGPPRSA